MLRRKFKLSLITLAFLQVLGFILPAKADYGVESRRPLSDPQKAKIDNRPVGTWRATLNTNQYYLHAGTGNIVGKSDWMELVLVHPGEKPSFYLHHKIGFVSVIGGQNYFNVANLSVQITQLRGTKPEELAAAVERYDILRYEVNGDTMNVWAADQKFVKAAIEAGKIKGNGATIEDTTENLVHFIESSPPALWGNKFTYTRVTGAMASTQSQTNKLRIGVFDSRAVAAAYMNSTDFQERLNADRADYAKAKEGKNEKRIREIEGRMKSMQRRAHEQVFSTGSVAEIMAMPTLKGALPGVAKKAGVQVIVSKWELNGQGPEAEVVDVTEDLAALFRISDEARAEGRDWKGILKHAPLPMSEVVD